MLTSPSLAVDGFRVESAAGVFGGNMETAVEGGEQDRRLPGVSVAQDVAQSFLNHPVDTQRGRRRQKYWRFPMGELGLKSFAFGVIRAELLDGLDQADPFQDRWMELAADTVELVGELHELPFLQVDAIAQGAGKLPLELRHFQYQAAQILRHGIVQFPRHALAFRLLTGEERPLGELESRGIADDDDTARDVSVAVAERASGHRGPDAFGSAGRADENLQPIHRLAFDYASQGKLVGGIRRQFIGQKQAEFSGYAGPIQSLPHAFQTSLQPHGSGDR